MKSLTTKNIFFYALFAFFVLSDAIDCTISQGDHAACMTRNVWLYYMWGTHPPLETISVICFKSRCNFLLFWFQFVDFSNIVLTSVCTMVLLRFPSIFIHFMITRSFCINASNCEESSLLLNANSWTFLLSFHLGRRAMSIDFVKMSTLYILKSPFVLG